MITLRDYLLVDIKFVENYVDAENVETYPNISFILISSSPIVVSKISPKLTVLPFIMIPIQIPNLQTQNTFNFTSYPYKIVMK